MSIINQLRKRRRVVLIVSVVVPLVLGAVLGMDVTLVRLDGINIVAQLSPKKTKK